MRPSPAGLILCDPKKGSLRIAALTVLDRLVVGLHRGGVGPIRIVCDGELPALDRARALGISIEHLPEMPVIKEPTVVAECRLLVQSGDVKAVIAGGGRLLDREGLAQPLGLVSTMSPGLATALDALPGIRATGAAGRVEDVTAAEAMADELWRSLDHPTDGYVDKYFNRPLGRLFSKALLHTPITPNQVTLVAAGAGLAGAYYFAQGTHREGIAGALLLQMSALIDCVDGEVARMGFKESPVGKWMDIGMDQVVHVAVFAGIAIGLARENSAAPVLWLGASAVVGALISFPVVVRGRALANKHGDTKLERFIDRISTRDFTALLILLAWFDKLHWFLWITAITVHVFWVTALVLQLPKSSKPGADAHVDADA